MPNLMNIHTMMAIMMMTVSLSLLLQQSQQQLAAAQDSGYNLTVHVSSHPFGKSSVFVSVKTENGHQNSANVNTAGGSSVNFFIPPNEGRTIQVCVSAGFFSGNCQRYIATGSDISVSLRAP